MKKVFVFIAVTVFFASISSARAAEALIESVAKGCDKELTTFCSTVTPGDGRVLACLYAHSDKLSGQCEFALYDAAVRLERFIAALSYVANECDADLDKFCAGVAAGEGRLLKCLEENAAGISSRCSQALKDVGEK